MPIDSILAARTIAIVGASEGERDYWSFNARITRSALSAGFDRVYLINPRTPTIHNQPTYPSLTALPQAVDLALIVVPASLLGTVISDCVESGTRFCWIISAGLAADDKARLRKLGRAGVLRSAGPNSIGYINNVLRTRAFAVGVEPSWQAGGLAVLSQSGGIASTIVRAAKEMGVASSYAVTTGDEVDLTVEDFFQDLLQSQHCRVFAFFLEQLRQPLKFRKLAREAAGGGATVVVMKIGRSPVGRRAALAHTGALVGDWQEAVATLSGDGVVVCDSIEALVDAAVAAALLPMRAMRKSVAVLTSSGAMGALAGDLVAENGLTFARLSDRTTDALTGLIGRPNPLWNPLDSSLAGGTTRLLPRYMAAVSEDPAVGAMVFIHSGVVYAEEITTELIKARSNSEVGLAVAWPGLPLEGMSQLGQSGIPVFEDAGRLFRTLGLLATRHWALAEATSPLSQFEPPTRNRRSLSYLDSTRLIRSWGIPAPDRTEISSLEDLLQLFSSESGSRAFVMKVARRALHKAAAGGVRLGIRTLDDAVEARKELAADVVLLEEWIDHQVEVLLDVRRSLYGYLLTVGWGGTDSNYVRDTVTLASPISRSRLRAALSETRIGARLRAGDASGRPLQVSQFLDMAVRLLEILGRSEVDEIELNPVAVTADVCLALDARVIVSAQAAAAISKGLGLPAAGRTRRSASANRPLG